MTTHLPDAAPTNWVDRYAPAALRPWLKLGRFDRPTGIWLLMLPGWQGIALAAAMQSRWPDPLLMAAFFVGAALMRAAGCAYNDIVDRDFDAKVARTAARPIPAGQISVKQAWAFVVACAMISLAILLTMGPVAIGLGVASLALVAAYPFMKRITWWPQAWLGLTFNWGALLGYAAVDALAGVKSSALRLGDAAPKAVLGFYVTAFVLALAAAWVGGLGPLFLPPAALFGVHLSRQAARLDVRDGVAALALFKSNSLAGLLLVIAMTAGMWDGPASAL
ncbi:MAG TPA: UbiA family prenyltransferase [Phenylobacterium sp.]|nr:UbiA family prenyltransferase [Phenylobacterium sp.]